MGTSLFIVIYLKSYIKGLTRSRLGVILGISNRDKDVLHMREYDTLDELLNSEEFKRELAQANYEPDYTGERMDTLADTGRYPEHMDL